VSLEVQMDIIHCTTKMAFHMLSKIFDIEVLALN